MASNDNTVKLLEPPAELEPLTFKGNIWDVNCVAFSPDGKRIAAAKSNKMVKLWDTVTGKESLTLKGHTQQVDSVAFSPDGKRIASGSGSHS